MGNEEQVSLDQVGIGEDMPPVEAKKVIVKSYNIEPIVQDGKHLWDKLVLSVEHPDVSERELQISSVKYEQGNKITIGGIWVKLDKDGKIPYRSSLAVLLRYYKVGKIFDLIGKEIETAQDDKGYLVIKSY